MDKNSVIGFILIALIFIGFTFFQSDRARKAAELQAQQDSIALAQMPPQRMASEAVLESAAVRLWPFIRILFLRTPPRPRRAS